MTEESPVRIDFRERNKGVIADFRANAGRNEGRAWPLVLLTTKGAKTGKPHVAPVCVREYRGNLVVAASTGGMRKHPQWYENLRAEPELTVEYLGDTYRARASTVRNGVERDHLF